MIECFIREPTSTAVHSRPKRSLVCAPSLSGPDASRVLRSPLSFLRIVLVLAPNLAVLLIFSPLLAQSPSRLKPSLTTPSYLSASVHGAPCTCGPTSPCLQVLFSSLDISSTMLLQQIPCAPPICSLLLLALI